MRETTRGSEGKMRGVAIRPEALRSEVVQARRTAAVLRATTAADSVGTGRWRCVEPSCSAAVLQGASLANAYTVLVYSQPSVSVVRW